MVDAWLIDDLGRKSSTRCVSINIPLDVQRHCVRFWTAIQAIGVSFLSSGMMYPPKILILHRTMLRKEISVTIDQCSICSIVFPCHRPPTSSPIDSDRSNDHSSRIFSRTRSNLSRTLLLTCTTYTWLLFVSRSRSIECSLSFLFLSPLSAR